MSSNRTTVDTPLFMPDLSGGVNETELNREVRSKLMTADKHVDITKSTVAVAAPDSEMISII